MLEAAEDVLRDRGTRSPCMTLPLETMVFVAQGPGGLSTAVAEVLGISRRPRQATAVRAPHGTIGVALLSEPAREWNSPRHRVFRDEVMPALRRARASAIGESSPAT
ncbi:hypothetical protein [Actinomycetospora sp. CA-053990]|uniref:hypothetical protein n=1 Tax=Actinomycetospora sp. CA-053990 TaxID=3239891 RepID=UPI003D918E2A